MTDDQDRAETAFRAAFGRAAAEFEPGEPSRTVRRRRRTWPAVAAAAALVAGTVGGVALLHRDDVRSGAHGPYADPEPTQTLAPPVQEWRYESYRDVVVQVPDSWGYAAAPGPDWCAFAQGNDRHRFPTTPYVSTTNSSSGVLAIGCSLGGDPPPLGLPAPEQYWATHLSFEDPATSGASDGTREYDGWTLITRTVGHAQLSVLADREHLDQARRIADSARRVDQDHNGCAATSPIQRGHFPSPPHAFDVAGLADVDSVAVCEYDLQSPDDQPGLMASRLLTGAAARDEVEALQTAPTGGGPNDASTCLTDMTGDTAVVLRISAAGGLHDVYGYMDWCVGNGFDDGTHVRALTAGDCQSLWGDRVWLWSGSSEPFRICRPNAAMR